MKVAIIQMASLPNDKAATIDKAMACIARCRGADLIILPELWPIGFMDFDRYIPDAESENGDLPAWLQNMAKKLDACIHGGSFVQVDQGRYYNTSLLIDNQGTVLASYRKIHLFGYRSREPRILSPGKSAVVIDTPIGRVGMATCYDLRFPELFRRMSAAGAQIFLICAAWPASRMAHWRLLNQARALENQCMSIAANAVGICQGIALAGNSMVVDPWGTVVAAAGDQETILMADIDLATVENARQTFPVLADRVDWLNPQPHA